MAREAGPTIWLTQREQYCAITQFHGFAGGHQAAGVFVQMRPHARKLRGELGIRIHAQGNNTFGGSYKSY